MHCPHPSQRNIHECNPGNRTSICGRQGLVLDESQSRMRRSQVKLRGSSNVHRLAARQMVKCMCRSVDVALCITSEVFAALTHFTLFLQPLCVGFAAVLNLGGPKLRRPCRFLEPLQMVCWQHAAQCGPAGVLGTGVRCGIAQPISGCTSAACARTAG